MRFVRQNTGAEGLQVHLIHAQVLFKERDIFFQLFLFRPGGSLGDEIVYKFKIPVIAHERSLLFCFAVVADIVPRQAGKYHGLFRIQGTPQN